METTILDTANRVADHLDRTGYPVDAKRIRAMGVVVEYGAALRGHIFDTETGSGKQIAAIGVDGMDVKRFADAVDRMESVLRATPDPGDTDD